VVSQKPKMTKFGLPETKSAGNLRFTIYEERRFDTNYAPICRVKLRIASFQYTIRQSRKQEWVIDFEGFTTLAFAERRFRCTIRQKLKKS